MVAAAPVLGKIDVIAPAAPWSAFGGTGPITLTAFESAVSNYYMTCAISRASVTMAQCTDAYVLNANTNSKTQTGTHG
jgi:NADH-quinone oxidoreductase subunit G